MSFSWKSISHSLVEWVIRRRSPALAVTRLGFGLVVLSLAGFALRLVVPTHYGPAYFSLSPTAGVPTLISSIVTCVGLILIVGGGIWEVMRDLAKHRRLAKKRIIALEVRGLRQSPGTALSNAIPATFEGRRDLMLVDLRQSRDGEIMDPEAAIQELSAIPRELKRRHAEGDRSDMTVVYAGLASVPFTFLTGVLVDDESLVHVMDWDRNQKVWRMLDGVDDGERFDLTALDAIEPGTPEVVVAISASYGVDLAGVQLKLPNLPRIELRLPHVHADSHWSLDKQRALGSQFLQTMKVLGDKGVHKIHLFLAAQNSVVFCFGQLYDKRNLPIVVVYQYEKHLSPPYPWGIAMPVTGQSAAVVT